MVEYTQLCGELLAGTHSAQNKLIPIRRNSDK